MPSKVAECTHIMPNGRKCKACAMRNSAFCYFHGRSQRPRRAGRPAENAFPLALVFEPESMQQACNEIAQALAGNHISNRRAALLYYGVQMASAQAPKLPPPMSDEEYQLLLESQMGRECGPSKSSK